MSIEKDKLWEEYFITGTSVLKNKLGVQNGDILKELEKIITKEELTKLFLEPIKGDFDVAHLLKLHEKIFERIYPFAGKIRNCTLQKDDHVFAEPENIEEYLMDVLQRMNNDFNRDIISKDVFAFDLAKYYYELIFIHPFREGNGRTIRAFLRDFVVEKSKNMSCGPLDLDYSKMDKNNLLLGTARRYLYYSLIEIEFMNGLVNKNDLLKRK